MKAYKCDRCGRLFEPYDEQYPKEKGEHYIGVYGFSSVRAYTDICKPCMYKFTEWFNHPECDKKIGSITSDDITDAVMKGEEILFNHASVLQDIYEKNHITEEE